MTTLDKMLQGLANALGASLSTLTTTAKTVVGAINELKSGLTTANTNISTNTSKIGSGSLDTTSQTLIGAVNELNSGLKSSVKSFTSGTNSSFSFTGKGLITLSGGSSAEWTVTVDGTQISVNITNYTTAIIPFYESVSGSTSSSAARYAVTLFN